MAYIDFKNTKRTPLSPEELLDFIRRLNEFERESQKADFIINAPAITQSEHPCARCPNNSANGGSGVCYCTLGGPAIT